MTLSIGKLALVCGVVLVVLVMTLVFIASMPSGSDIGRFVTNALDDGGMSQTSVQVCVGFLNIGSCRSTQTQSAQWRPASSGGFSFLPVLMILAAGMLSVIFIGWIGLWLSGESR